MGTSAKERAKETITHLERNIKRANEEIARAKAQVTTVTRQAQEDFFRFKEETKIAFSNAIERETKKGLLGKARSFGHALKKISGAKRPTSAAKADFKAGAVLDS